MPDPSKALSCWACRRVSSIFSGVWSTDFPPGRIALNKIPRATRPSRIPGRIGALQGFYQLILASTGLWSLPSAGSTQELSGSTPLTRIWSIRTTGKDAGR